MQFALIQLGLTIAHVRLGFQVMEEIAVVSSAIFIYLYLIYNTEVFNKQFMEISSNQLDLLSQCLNETIMKGHVKVNQHLYFR